MMNPLRRILDAILGPPAPERDHAPDDSVVAGYAGSEIEADIWRTILADNSIPSAVVGPASVPLYGVYDSTIRLEVLQRDLASAREILALNDEGRPLDEPGLAPLERDPALKNTDDTPDAIA